MRKVYTLLQRALKKKLEGEDVEQELEIEIVDPEMVTLDDGSVEITIIPGDDMGEGGFDENLAESLDEGEIQELSGRLVGTCRRRPR